MTALTIEPAMRLGGPVEPGALWVGLLEAETLAAATGDRISLVDADGFETARLLVRVDGAVRGYVTLPVEARGSALPAARDAVAELMSVTGTDRAEAPDLDRGVEPRHPERVAVVVCTRDRADQLREALESILRCDDEHFDVFVVDNAPATGATRQVVDEIADERVRYVLEPVAGLSTARNAGIAAADADIVAFTDDDVVVDRLWITWIRAAFAAAPDAACVSGLVPSGELRNDVQRYFDARVSWSKNVARSEFRMSDPPPHLPMFPFCVGEYGTGANFAVRTAAVTAVGGFDPCLGVGTRTRGGEDIDMFVRLLLAGHALVVEPSAIVWHRHRADFEALRHQAIGYGTGLGAWLTKVAVQPRTLSMALRRSPQALRRLVRKPMDTVDGRALSTLDERVRSVGRLELVRVLAGPFALASQRRAHRLRRRLSAEAVRA